ncbi:MAG: polysaccharide deacetylase family protein [Chitinophagales bacterium]
MQGVKKIYFSGFNQTNKKKEIPELIKRSGIKIIFPFYHVVSDEYLPHIKHLYPYKNIAQFKDDLDLFLKYYEPLGVDDYVAGNFNKNKNYFILSFDDGLKEMYEIVEPILKQKGIPAIFFINSMFVDNKDLFYRYSISLIIEALKTDAIFQRVKKYLSNKSVSLSAIKIYLLTRGYNDREFIKKLMQIAAIDSEGFLRSQQPYMTIQQLKELTAQGFTIGAHSADHPDYTVISETSQIDQTAQSVNFIRGRFPGKYSYFAFPFSADGVSEKVFNTLYSDAGIDLSFGTSGIKNNPGSKHINRIPMEEIGYSAEEIIKNEYAYFLLKRMLGR